ncbi:MAG: hypothetical protein FGM33_07365 [Candidatus Kapabacteria bacterium]|nr:hypothetical protein [Candidatus Kapabacteria bacterium]
MSRPMLIRIRIILQHLSNGQRVTAGHMARLLDVSQRTVARDFDYMINGLDLPIKYEFTQRSYVLDGPLPSIFDVTGSKDGASGGLAPAVPRHRAAAAAARPKRNVRSRGAK